MMYEKIIETPIGPWVVQTLERKITWLAPIDMPRVKQISQNAAILQLAEQQVLSYFAGERMEFELASAFELTDIQADIFEAIMLIPYGETRTIQQVAAFIEKPEAVQAVKRALLHNGLWLIVPTHRVVDEGQEMFPGARLIEQQLLRHERDHRIL